MSIQDKMARTEKCLKEEAEQKEREHSQQFQNLQQASARMLSRLEDHERQSQRNVSNLNSAIASLQKNQSQLMSKISELQSQLNQRPDN